MKGRKLKGLGAEGSSLAPGNRMEKLKTRYICQNCGHSSLRWLGRCPSCEEWDTLVEEAVRSSGAKDSVSVTSTVYSLPEIQTEHSKRIPIGIFEFDRLLGGGIVPGSVTLLGGEPGIGKSTLLLQVASQLANKGISALYITGEESVGQTKLRAQRLGLHGSNLYLLSETNLDAIQVHITNLKPQAVVIDSIQIMYLPALSSAPGSVAQVRECASLLTALVKKEGISLFLVGHVTKSGAIAGPRVVEHIVDTVLYFEGDTHNRYRILRAVKNRFGSTEEIGIFSMQADGLQEVSNPSEIFLSRGEDHVSGSIVVAAIEGTRPILVELQALVAPTIYGMPERRTIGLDYRRLAILLAVLEKRAGLRLQNQDVFVNVVGGVKLSEPAIDLGTVLSVVSSFREIPIPRGTVAIGEVGLGGEIRAVREVGRRIAEAQRLGFKEIILPRSNTEQIAGKSNGANIKVVGVNTVTDAVKYLFGINTSRHSEKCTQ